MHRRAGNHDIMSLYTAFLPPRQLQPTRCRYGPAKSSFRRAKGRFLSHIVFGVCTRRRREAAEAKKTAPCCAAAALGREARLGTTSRGSLNKVSKDIGAW